MEFLDILSTFNRHVSIIGYFKEDFHKIQRDNITYNVLFIRSFAVHLKLRFFTAPTYNKP